MKRWEIERPQAAFAYMSVCLYVRMSVRMSVCMYVFHRRLFSSVLHPNTRFDSPDGPLQENGSLAMCIPISVGVAMPWNIEREKHDRKRCDFAANLESPGLNHNLDLELN